MRIAIAATVACLSIVGVTATAQVHAAIRKHTEIPAEPLDLALRTLAKDRGFQVVYLTEDVRTLQTRGATCDCTVDEALKKLLSDSRLEYKFVDENTVSIFPKSVPTSALEDRDGASASVRSEESSADSPKSSSEQRLRLAQVDQRQTSVPVSVSQQDAQDSQKKADLEEIVVTGSHIHGAGSTSSPVTVITRDDITRSGVSTTDELVRTLPQNFGGGATDLTNGQFSAGEGSNNNYSGGTGVNLRGLGSDATLVLLNGRRLAAAGVGNYVDVSLIPLSAIDRVEVMTDGASAIYGSDAIGGVVNIITRKQFDGAETRLRYGSVTNGDRQELQAGQLFGTEWDSGSALISYDFRHDDALSARDRSFAEGLAVTPSGAPSNVPVDLLPYQTTQNVFASAAQSLPHGIETFADGYYDRRSIHGSDAYFPGTAIDVVDAQALSEQYGGTVGLSTLIAPTWHADLAATYSRNNTTQNNELGGLPFGSNFSGHSSVVAIDGSTDGTLFELPGGPAKLAVGAQFRRESYDSEGKAVPLSAEASRTVDAAFAELSAPIVGDANSVPGIKSLTLSAAGRYEHYSDFGSSTNPRLGISWLPVSDLAIRGSWGTSFRAPLLSELDNSHPTIVALPLPGVSGTTPSIYVAGGNPDLHPEKATTWTAGLDVTPHFLPGFKMALTYFSINFKDRTAAPIPTTLLTAVLKNEGPYAPFIILDPSAALVAQYFGNPAFANPYHLGAASIGAILDDTLTNVDQRNERGVDLSINDKIETAIGRFDGSISATYLTQLQDTVLPNTAPVSLVNTLFYPIRFRMRDSIGWTKDGLSATAFLNYAGAYTNNLTIPSQSIASWTTIDLTVQYNTGTNASLRVARNIVFSAGVLNAFNRDPPYVTATAASAVNFDAANASPLGRFVYVQISKGW